MDTTTIIAIVAASFLTLLPVLKYLAKKTDTVIDDKILTLLGGWVKRFVK